MSKLKTILHHLQRLPFEIFVLVVVLATALLSSPLVKLLTPLFKLDG